MRLSLPRFVAWAALTAVWCTSSYAQAQHSLREQGKVTLRLQILQPGSVASVERYVRGAAPALVLRCDELCSAQLPRGRYRLLLRSNDREVPDSTSIRLIEPVLFTSRPARPAAKYTGILMIGGGALAAVSGIIAITYSAIDQMCHGYMCAADSPKYLWYGVAATPLGALLVLAGWLIFSNAQRSFDREPLASRDALLKVALAATPQGASAIVVGAL